MVLFLPGKGGSDEVDYGYKGKGVTLHAVVDGNGLPLVVISTSAKGDERQELRYKLRCKGIKPRIPRRQWFKRKQMRGRKPPLLIDRWKRKVSDYGFDDFMKILEAKAKENKKQIMYIDKWYPSSKTCSNCNYVQRVATGR